MKRLLTFSLIVFVFTTAAGRALAQQDGDLVICGKKRDAAHAWSWESIVKRYSKELAAGDYKSIYQTVAEAFRTSSYRKKNDDIKKRFQTKLDSFLITAPKGGRSFDITKDVSDITAVKLVIFKGEEQQIDISRECGPNNEYAEQLDELRYFAYAIVNVTDLEASPLRDRALARIKKIEEQYDRYLFEGYPMFPWEALVNSWFLTDDSIADGPPRSQLVFFHLGVGIEVDTISTEGSKRGTVVTLEPLGLIRYPADKDYRSWWGISSLLTFRNDMGYGAGLAVHYNDFSLGATWHDRNGRGSVFDDRPFVFVGIDLYRYLDSQKRSYAQYRDKLDDYKQRYMKDLK